ncbi:hypothetical protein EN938_32050, partial [Mesorhizobium sp. M7A.F.Ca.US.001.02.1.1]
MNCCVLLGEVASEWAFVKELEIAADGIADMFRANLQIILRRAALMLRNVAGLPPEPATQDALNSLAAEMNIGRYHSD